MDPIKPKDAAGRLIAALDVPDLQTGLDLLGRLKGQVGLVKIGLELFTACGPAAVEEIRKLGFDIFLDLKLHDIPNTVAGAVRSACALGVQMLTVHTGGGEAMLRRAVESADGKTLVLGVTLLTSLGADDLESVCIIPDPREVVRRRAVLAAKTGLSGVVCSPKEVALVRHILGQQAVIVTPGIRPKRAALEDQKRAATPFSAIRDGADYLVVGRPIHGSDDPRAATAGIVAEIEEALANR